MEELTEVQLRILKKAEFHPFFPSDLQEFEHVKHLLEVGFLSREAGRYKLSDDGLRYIVRRGLDGSEHYLHGTS